MRKRIIILFLIVSMLTACNKIDEETTLKVNEIGHRAIVSQQDANSAKQLLLKNDEIVDVKAVVLEKQLYVAVNVKQFARLRLKKIRQKSFSQLKKNFPEKTIHVSSDKKIYLELEQLEKKLQTKAMPKKELEDKLKKIDEDMKG